MQSPLHPSRADDRERFLTGLRTAEWQEHMSYLSEWERDRSLDV